MTRSVFYATALTLACAILCACSPGAARTRSSAAAPASPTLPPVKPMKMICKNSQNGVKAECGTPNAVMVGMEPA